MVNFAFDFDLLRAFVAVVETGGFTRAAERLNLSQSAVSLQLKRLETNLGKSLLDRDKAPAGIGMTEQGEAFLPYARKLISTAVEAADVLRVPASPRTVRLGVPEDFAGRKLIELLMGFAEACPGIRLDTISGWSFDLRRRLVAGEIDLALIKREAGNSGPALGSWTEPLTWVGGPSGQAHHDPISLAVFPMGCIYRDRAITSLEKQGKRWRISYESQGLMGVQAAVASGLGVSLLPRSALLPEHCQLDARDGFEEQPDTELALVKGKDRLTAEVEELADYLIKVIRV